MTDFIVSFLALLAVFVQAALLALLLCALGACVSSRARRLLIGLRRGLSGFELPLAWLVATVATSGSLYFSEVAGFLPCRLCWFQREAMYPLVLLLALAALPPLRRRARLLLPLLMILPFTGLAISAHHHYIERFPAAESASCKIGIPCSTRWIWEFGYISIPVLAGTAFAFISVLLLFAYRRPGSPTDF